VTRRKSACWFWSARILSERLEKDTNVRRDCLNRSRIDVLLLQVLPGRNKGSRNETA
jgi:hypothetical protein